ncbi:PREDICTED: transmembrane protein 147-like [Acropora digitifera]|uniref:transmembrane protein 147-like n=1 Tax=Acropora digitifera TaxID=70779 RepID=UPI00077B25CB|nr:PREDICTED: transmembrane protein 147-like [Acropora digitifera]
MTLFHFGNCIALAYFPYFIVYKCSGLSEYSAFWRCVKAGATYLVTQLCKMLVLATFFPTSDVPPGYIDVPGVGWLIFQGNLTATLVWLWSRNDLQKSLLPIVMVFMVLTCYRPLLIEVLSHALGIQSWSLLLLNTFVTGSIGIVALQLYLTLATDEEARS